MTGALDRALMSGVAVFRLAMWAWATILVIAEQDELDAPELGWALLSAAGVVSIVAAVAPRRLAREAVQWITVAEVVVGAVVLAAAPAVVDGGTVQSFGSAWPVAGVLAAAVIGGSSAGIAAGLTLTVGRAIGAGIDPTASGFVGAFAAGALFVLTGAAGGWLVTRLRRAEEEIADTRARESFARALHDEVLQTLAVIQRRSDDGELVELARRQEGELRQLIDGRVGRSAGLIEELRRSADEAATRWELRVQFAVVDEPDADWPLVATARSAVGEAVNNAGKHGGASTVTVFVDGDEASLHIEVADDGDGFEVDPADFRGIRRSIIEPVTARGGATEIDSKPGQGTRVIVELPVKGAP